jgi:hypothetical protein
MKWPWLPPTRKDMAIIAAMIAIGFAMVYLLLLYPFGTQRLNFGFGPEWTCTAHPKGEPTCIKKKL